jgi:TonB family protein
MLCVVALLVVSSGSFSSGQQTGPSAPSPLPDAQPAHVKVYAIGPGITAPELLPLNPTPIPTGKCKNKQDGIVILSVIVDATGQPRNLVFFHPVGTDLDKFALQIAAADRFKPGTSDGAPIAVAQLLDVIMQSCIDEKKDDAGKKTYQLRLLSQPVQKFAPLPQPPEEAVLSSASSNLNDPDSAAVHDFRVGSGVSAPVLLMSAEAEFSKDARRAKYEGTCMISLVVDAHGMPQNVHVDRPLDYGLSENSIEAVNKYRFKPAMKNGQPVPVRIDVEVNFHLY